MIQRYHMYGTDYCHVTESTGEWVKWDEVIEVIELRRSVIRGAIRLYIGEPTIKWGLEQRLDEIDTILERLKNG